MKKRSGLLWGLGAAAAVGIGFALLGGDANASESTREPWTKTIDLPDTPAEIAMVKTTICTCWRAGVTDELDLGFCTLERVYEDVPWRKLLPPREGDDPSLYNVAALIAGWVLEFLALPTEAAREAWCSGDDGLGPLPEPPGPEPEPEPEPEPSPTLGTGLSDVGKRKLVLDGLVSTQAVDGALWRTFAKDPVGVGGIETIAKTMLKAAGVAKPDYHALVLPLMKAIVNGWNRVYARSAKGGEYWAVAGEVVDPALRPTHKDAVAAILAGHYPERNIDNAGKKIGAGAEYGLLWLPKFDHDLARQGVLEILAPEPPAELLNLLS